MKTLFFKGKDSFSRGTNSEPPSLYIKIHLLMETRKKIIAATISQYLNQTSQVEKYLFPFKSDN